jgi:type VI secretion system protein ImpE
MTAGELLEAGRLDEAIAALGADLRQDPADVRRRSFLFELLCFAGAYDRAERQLEVLAQAGPQAELGAAFYRAALRAERARQALFAEGGPTPDMGVARPVSARVDGRTVANLRDADPRIGARLELFAAGQYLWLPLEHVASVSLEPPRRLRDLLWAPAVVRAGPGFEGRELGEVLLPALAAGSARDEDAAVRLGRVTEWAELDDGTVVPLGQKLLLGDGAAGEEEFALLAVREVEVLAAPAAVP